MTSSNRVRLSGVAEATFGETPANPRMRRQRVTSIGLSLKPEYVESDDIRDDRMASAPIMVGESNTGQIGIEWHYPLPGSLLDEEIKSAFCNDWVNTPWRDNDGVADSVISAVVATGGVVTVAAGAAFVAGHLVRFTKFGMSANNTIAKCTTGSATVPAFAGAGLVDEAAPAANARMKVIGLEGAASDLTALADGLGSMALDFTTFNLSIGQWVKIGDVGAAYRFATAGANGRARIVDIAANKLTLDNLPAAWATDNGNGKTIRVFFGDVIRNGVQKMGVTLERGFMGQTVPTYIPQRGMRINTLEFGGQAKQKASGSLSFVGMRGESSQVPLDASPDDAPDDVNYPVFAFSANCGRVGYGGGALGTPNWAKALKFTLNNNLRPLDAIADGDSNAPGPVDVQDGAFDLAVELDCYFGNDSILNDILTGTGRAVNAWLDKNGKAIVWEAPYLTPREGDPTVSGKNQDVMLPVRATASKDPVTGVQCILNRFEFVR
ncbi:hypothetical protein J2847_006418 [Azospirillum agricola]|uniref:phage tail tube protein n=1 Tax=Azospirillum agricola TaxID=1720247 RepID=UPI001AE1ACB9|nr:phage tail tube protein [Azospirillum agricola]MBP2233083.1 hypothetical protein [Azospirillum agricola]